MRLAALLSALLLWPLAAAAQFATLVADSVRVAGETLIADGNVEVLYQGRRVLGSRIVYDGAAETLQIAGPLTLIDTDGTVVTGDSALLDADLEAGLLRGARVVLDDQLQMAATEFNRVSGRYNQLYKAVASSCQICPERPVPLWQIRARRVVHDQIERQIYFDDARFEVMGVPIAYFPRLRLPDPTLKRATGFLIPSIKNSTQLGFGVKAPYFIVMGDHADLTLTPYVSPETRTLEARYRQAYRFGTLELNGAVSRDNLKPDDIRAYLFGEARFNLPGDFRLNVDVEVTSDPAYLLAYGYSGKDRLSSEVEITRTRRDEHISGKVQLLRSLRGSEIPIEDSLATRLAHASYERRMFPAALGGEARLKFEMQGYERKAERVTPALAAACAAAGVATCTARDVFRTDLTLGWKRDWTFGNGMIGKLDGQVSTDTYWIGQDNTFTSPASHVTPALAAELRWPMARRTASGARDVLEPVVQLAWSEVYGDRVPNEDSTLVDFDEGNLLSLSRFPGEDARETGLRATLGFSWTRVDDSGLNFGIGAGRVIRAADEGQFTRASGLDGATSDWLVAGRVELGERLSVMNRTLFDDTLEVTKSETRLVWDGRRISAATSYVWVVADAAESRPSDISEWNMDGAYRFDRHWTGTFGWRYDVATNRAARAEVGLEYRNECVLVDFSLARRFTSAANVAPTTDIGLRVGLNGFGNDGRAYRRSCGVKG